MPTIKYKPTTPARRNMSVPSFEEITKKSLVVLADNDSKAVRSLANIAGVKVSQYNTINVYDILNCGSLVVAKAAIEKIEEVYAK